LAKGLSKFPIDLPRISSNLADYARLATTTWPVTISREAASRYTLTIPEGIRKLRLVPDSEGLIVMHATGEVVELWPASAWADYVRKLAVTRTLVERRAMEELESRENNEES